MAYNINLAAGKYTAHANDAGVYDTEGGACMLGVKWELENPTNDTITSRICLVSKAGVVQEKRIKEIRTWAQGWNGYDMDWFENHFHEFEVQLTIQRRVDSYDGKEKPEVAYIDPIGGGTEHSGITHADPKAMSAKYGALLRAVAGTMPKPVAAPTPAAQAAPSASKAPAANNVEGTKEAAWKAFLDDLYEGDAGDEAGRNSAWFALLKSAVPNKNAAEFTAADWGAVLAKIETEKVPF